MKIKLLPIVTIFLAIYSITVIAQPPIPNDEPTVGYHSDTGKITYKINKGWNTVYFGGGINNDDYPNTCDIDSIRQKGYTWSPTEKRWLVSNSDYYEIIQRDEETNWYAYAPSGFVYSDKDCYLTTSIYGINNEQMSSILKSKKMAKGWNFITINPNFANVKFSNLLGDCKLKYLYTWQNDPPTWVGGPVTQDMIDSTDYYYLSSHIGLVILMKFENDCYFSLSDFSGPPPLPE